MRDLVARRPAGRSLEARSTSARSSSTSTSRPSSAGTGCSPPPKRNSPNPVTT
ncbi:hypothetical protein NKH77_53050 [Streptomyces sp. M19]